MSGMICEMIIILVALVIVYRLIGDNSHNDED